MSKAGVKLKVSSLMNYLGALSPPQWYTRESNTVGLYIYYVIKNNRGPPNYSPW